jgi:hypothetical protein
MRTSQIRPGETHGYALDHLQMTFRSQTSLVTEEESGEVGE